MSPRTNMRPKLPPKVHYRNGGSVIARRKQCKGSLWAEEQYPEEETTEASDKGTRIHYCIEKLCPTAIANWNKPNIWEGADPLHMYDQEEIDAAKLCVKKVLELMGDKVPHVAWALETKFVINHELEVGGTTDVGWGYYQSNKKIVEILDYKNGVRPHRANTSMQIKQYLAGIQHVLGKKKPFDVLIGHIFQPNSLDQNNTYTRVEYTAEEIAQEIIIQTEIAAAAFDVPQDDYEQYLTAGPECFFCKHKPRCGAFHAQNDDKALSVLELHDAQTKELIVSNNATAIATKLDTIVKSLTDEQLKDFALQIPYIREAAKAVEDHIKTRHKAGKPIDGLKCVPTTPRRQWAKNQTLKEQGEGIKKLGIDKPYKQAMRNLTDIQEELQAKGMTEDEAKAALEPYVSMTTPGLSIIPDAEGDDRQDIAVVNVDIATAVIDSV